MNIKTEYDESKNYEYEKLSEIRLELLPMAAEIWDEDLNLIDCNQQTLDMFRVSDKKEYLDRVHVLYPKFQPCGTSSDEKRLEYLFKAFREGRAKFGYTQITLDGEIFPVDITLVRIKHGGKFLVFVYFTDLRPFKDITERERRLERERGVVENQLMMYESLPIAVNLFDESLSLFDCNTEAVNIFGFGDKKTYMEKFNILTFSPKYQPCGTATEEKLNQILQSAYMAGRAKCEWMYLTAQGEELPVELTIVTAPRLDTYVIMAYMSDMSLIKAAQENERRIHELHQMTFDSAPFVIAIWDENGNIVKVSDHAKEFFGVSDPTAAVERLFEFSPPIQPCGTPTPQKAAKYWNVAHKEGFARFEWTHLSAHGVLIPAECVYKTFLYDGKQMMVSYTKDLTDIKEAEAKVQEARERIQLMFDNTPMIIQYWDEDYNCIDCNQTTLDFYGFQDKEEYFAKLEEVTPEFQPDGTRSSDKWNEYLAKVFEEWSYSIDFLEKDLNGEDAYCEVTGFRTNYNGSTVVLTYSTDVTEIRKMQARRNLMKVAEESNKAKSRFLAKMSHEIRTPISAILGVSQIQLHNSKLPQSEKEAFAKIYNSSNLLLGIVKDILDLSKIEAGKMDLTQTEYDLASLISNVSQMNMTYIGDKGIKFSLNIDESLPAYLVGDTIRIEQIMNNVLSNAFKYTKKGSVELKISCPEIVSAQEDEFVTLVFSIRDTGIGMTKKQLDIIHHEYMRFNEVDNDHIGGTGLGMSITYKLVELMNANITIESEVGVGTHVQIFLPQKRSRPDIISKEVVFSLQQFELNSQAIDEQSNFDPEWMSYGKVLVVDDIDVNLYVARGLLEFYGLEVETCMSGYEVIDKIEQGKVYDIIFMDHMMPDMSGTKTMKYIRSIGYTEPIVVLTANAMIGQAEKFIKQGFDDFVSKPIQTKSLNAVLIKYIKDKQPPEVIEATKKLSNHRTASSTNIKDYQSDEDELVKFREDFAKGQNDALFKILQALEIGDNNTAHIVAHSVKGLAALIKEPTLSKAAEQVEYCIAEGEPMPEGIMATFRQELNRVLEAIGEVSSNQNKAIEVLDMLEPLLVERNAKSLEYLEELKGIPEAAILVRQIEEFEFSAALKSITTLRVILEN